MTSPVEKIHARLGTCGIFFAGLLILGGCASVPPPTALLSDAQSARDSAAALDAATYAPVDLRNADDKLAAANAASAKHDYARATALAEAAEIDAELASAKSRQNKARAEAERKNAENQRLKRDLERGEKSQ